MFFANDVNDWNFFIMLAAIGVAITTVKNVIGYVKGK